MDTPLKEAIYVLLNVKYEMPLEMSPCQNLEQASPIGNIKAYFSDVWNIHSGHLPCSQIFMWPPSGAIQSTILGQLLLELP